MAIALRVLEVRELGARGYRLLERHRGDVQVNVAPFLGLRIDLAEMWA